MGCLITERSKILQTQFVLLITSITIKVKKKLDVSTSLQYKLTEILLCAKIICWQSALLMITAKVHIIKYEVFVICIKLYP